MIVLKIIGLFLLFLLLLTFLSLGITVHYQQEELKVYANYSFIKLQLFPEKKKKKQKKKSSNRSNPKKKKPTKKVSSPTISETKESVTKAPKATISPQAKPIATPDNNTTKKEPENHEEEEKEPFSQRISTLLDLLRSCKKALLTIKEHAIVDQLEAYLSIGGEDAHQTALNFSYHQIAIAKILAFLGEFLNIQLKQIVLMPNFLSEESQYEVHIRLRIRPFWVIKAGIHLLIAYMKLQQTNKGGKKHERKTTTSK